jgi:DNA-binding transcriptional ArsR family regulator
MAISETESLDRTFAALADTTRRAILARLASGEVTLTELMKPFAISQLLFRATFEFLSRLV